ncbi:acyltransferase [Mycolicibacterium sphagni]|uniref:Acyltransferase n=2 Tax=Mycolicibacterium sphagni TaxID=1786 RepID=A0A255DG16_9MYCO|nr:acyltransferase [Mycolicibacterium sphagni]
MRAVAVLTVFANHLFNWPSGGFVGVDVFFVLSGFFITGLLIRERKTTRHLSFQNFYTRRVKRIIPSAVLVLTVTVGGAYLLFTATRAKDTLVDALYAAVFASNWHFEAVGADYFQSARPPSPIQHYWSLSIEEQFYFVWPFLIALVFAATRSIRRRANRRAREWALSAVMFTVVAASFAWAMYLSAVDPNAAYFSTFTRVWELGVGAMLAIAGPMLERIPSHLRPVLAYLGLAGVAASLFLISPTVRFPAPWAALPVLATALVVASYHGAPIPRLLLPLTNRAARWFGDTSYTLYLWHWPVITLLYAILPRGWLFYSIAIALSLGLTAVTYHFYEDPLRKSQWLLPRTSKRDRRTRPAVWGLSGLVAASLVVISILVIQTADDAAVTQELARGQDDPQPTQFAAPAQKVDPCFGAPAMVTPGCALRNPDVPLRPSVDTFARDTQGQLNCNIAATSGACHYGYDGDGALRIALVGDSHAQAILPALRSTLQANKWSLTAYVGTDCILSNPPAPGKMCHDALAQTESDLVAHPYDLVIIANFDYGLPVNNYLAAWTPVAKAGSRFLVLRDNPATSADALACLTRVSLDGDHTGECGTPIAQAFPENQTLPAAAQAVPGATLLDLTRFYCNADRCPSVIGNAIVYRDLKDGVNSHLTATFAKTLAPAIQDGIRQALASGLQQPH